MERRRLAWLLCLPLAAIGGLSAHLLAYSLVGSSPHPTGHVHAETPSHGYVSHWRLCLAVCFALIAIGLVGYAVQAARGGQHPRVPVWLFGLLPPAGFVVQEHIERLLGSGTISPTTVLEPTFVVGLLLQIPFALAAFLVARALLTFAVAVARALASEQPPALVAALPGLTPTWEIDLPRVTPLALGHGQRGPPDLLLSR